MVVERETHIRDVQQRNRQQLCYAIMLYQAKSLIYKWDREEKFLQQIRNTHPARIQTNHSYTNIQTTTVYTREKKKNLC